MRQRKCTVNKVIATYDNYFGVGDTEEEALTNLKDNCETEGAELDEGDSVTVYRTSSSRDGSLKYTLSVA